MVDLFSFITKEEIEKLVKETGLDIQELKSLYNRFLYLDVKKNGFLVPKDFLSIPDLAINPLGPRMVEIIPKIKNVYKKTKNDDSVDFLSFVIVSSLFSKKGLEKYRKKFVFMVLDLDSDGIISKEDISGILELICYDKEFNKKLIEECFMDSDRITEDVFDKTDCLSKLVSLF